MIDHTMLKKTYAVKNPVYLKRDTLILERDSTLRNIHYISFNYDALVDFTLNLYFNAKKNIQERNPASYLPGKNFVDKTVSVRCVKGHNVAMLDRALNIDIDYFKGAKEVSDDAFDVVIELVPDVRTPNNEQILFVTLCQIVEEVLDNNNSIFKIKTELQKFKSMNMWIDVFDLFNTARET